MAQHTADTTVAHQDITVGIMGGMAIRVAQALDGQGTIGTEATYRQVVIRRRLLAEDRPGARRRLVS